MKFTTKEAYKILELQRDRDASTSSHIVHRYPEELKDVYNKVNSTTLIDLSDYQKKFFYFSFNRRFFGLYINLNAKTIRINLIPKFFQKTKKRKFTANDSCT